MFSPSRILVPTDMSEYSDRAIRQALDIAKLFNSKVFVIHVLKDPTQLCTVDYCVSQELMDRYAAETLQAARRAILSQLVKFRSMGDISIATEVGIGVPEEVLLKEAEDKQIDLIVIASGGTSALAKYFMGNIARHLLQEAKCAVLVVK